MSADYKLVFDDEFSVPSLSPNGGGIYKWYRGVWFWGTQAPTANYDPDFGHIGLTWTSDMTLGETSMSTLSADRQTYSAFRYGYFEVRMKWPVVTGAWPAIRLIPIQAAQGTAIYNGVPEEGEIDIFEGQGSKPQQFIGTIHDRIGNQDSTNKNNTYILPENNDFTDYHTYGVLWVPGKVTWFYDKKPLMSAPTPAVFDKQDYILVLGMGEGMNGVYGNHAGVTVPKMTMNVQWVRVWQR